MSPKEALKGISDWINDQVNRQTLYFTPQGGELRYIDQGKFVALNKYLGVLKEALAPKDDEDDAGT